MEMEAKDRFRKTVAVALLIERNLESHARVVEGNQENGDHLKWEALVKDLSALFPDEDCDKLAQTLVTEACRTAYLKMKNDIRARDFTSQR